MGVVRFGVLGPLQVFNGDRRLQLGGPKSRSVLASLILAAERLVRTDALVDVLWGERPPATAVKTVQKHVFLLRHRLGDPDLIVSQDGGYKLRAQDVDARRFELLVDEAASAASPEVAEKLLTEALALWRGEPYADLGDVPAAYAERRRLEERRLAAVESLCEVRLALGQYGVLVGRLEELVAEHPLRERLWGQLMTALYRSGRQADALAAYQRLRRTLVEQVGVEPMPELRLLHEQILGQDQLLREGDRSSAPAGNVPSRMTSFVGRRMELDDLGALLAGHRLITLTGPGGSGKTRLALELGARIRRPGGVWLVELEGLTAVGQIPLAVAGVFRLGEQSGSTISEVLVDFLQNRQLLLLLDNCEHLVIATAEIVDLLLRSAPGLQVVATSRQPLGVEGEVTYEVSPLAVPRTDDRADLDSSDAARLLVERARAGNPHFAVSAANAAGLARICRRLDGIPLALELAAARLRAFDADRLADLLDERFRVLVSAVRAAPPRHQTLRAAVAWSHDLLTEDERWLFRRLTIFEGGFTLEAAEQICGDADAAGPDALTLLPSLVDQSLVAVVGQPDGGTRYRLLETLREYGRAELDAEEASVVHRRHAEFFCALAERSDRGLRGPRRAESMTRLDADRDNIRAALNWSIAHRVRELTLRLASAMATYWAQRASAGEGRDWLRTALRGSMEVAPAVEAAALAGTAMLALDQGDHDDAVGPAERSLELSQVVEDDRGIGVASVLLGEIALFRGDYAKARRLLDRGRAIFERADLTWELAWALERLGHAMRQQGEYEQARAHYEKALTLHRHLGDTIEIGRIIWYLGVVARYAADYPRATGLCQEALSLFDEVGDEPGVAHVRYTLGDLARLQGRRALAVRLYEESLRSLREMGDKRCVASTLYNLADVAVRGSEPDRAADLLSESLAMRHRMGDKPGVAECLEGFAAVSAARGDPRTAARMLGAAHALREASGAIRPASDDKEFAALVEELRAALGDSEFRDAWDAGRLNQSGPE